MARWSTALSLAEKDGKTERVERVDSHTDEPHASPPDDAAVFKRVTRKFDRHIIPWLFGLWLLAFIDRSNIGNARIDGLEQEVTSGADQFNIALAVFYVPYIIVDVPSNWVMKKFKAGHYLPALVFCWGIVSTCTGFVTTYGGLIAARFFLGLCEGGLLGGMILYLSMFYPRHKLMYRVSLFYCAAPLSGAFGGLLATGLAEINSGSYHGWPFIFFVEGAITILFGALAFCFLPHTPAEAAFLSPQERDVAIAQLVGDYHQSEKSPAIAHDPSKARQVSIDEDKFAWHWVRLALLNANTMLLSFNFFAIITPIYSFSLFLPTIVDSFGHGRVVAQLLTVPPNICGFLAVLAAGVLSDRYRMRGPGMLIGALIGIAGYAVLLGASSSNGRYGGTFLVAAGIYPCSPLVMSWLANNLHPHYVRATGTGFQIAVANCAAFIATFTYLKQDAPRYVTGHAINLAFMSLSLILTALTMAYCSWENKVRNRGGRDGRLRDAGPEAETMLGHRHPGFRYTL